MTRFIYRQNDGADAHAQAQDPTNLETNVCAGWRISAWCVIYVRMHVLQNV